MIRPDGKIIPTSFDDAAWHRKPSGFLWLDGKEVASTVQCCHCGGHFPWRKGSGTLRGFCRNCMDGGRLGMLCGKPQCFNDCIQYEKKVELHEAGKLKVLR